jgi:hypothetical protein
MELPKMIMRQVDCAAMDAETALEILGKQARLFSNITFDLDGAEYRLIDALEIDTIMKDELLADTYILGCCNAWFISDMTGLDIETIERAQKNESFELLGCLMEKNIDEVQQGMASADGYGHHFSSYDGSEIEFHADGKDWYLFRTN